MKRNFFKGAALAALALVGFTATAQEEEAKSPLSITGSVDTYYQTYLTAPDDAGAGFGTAFAGQSGFAVGMGNIIASYEGAKSGAVLDLVTGPRGAGATFNSDIVNGIVNQAYAYLNVSESTTFTIGRFNTFLGYEVIAPAANFNYSTSYLFSSGPFSHVGVKADFALSDDLSLMLAVTNPWDTNDISGTGQYALGAQLGYKGQFLNLYYDGGEYEGLGFEIDYTGGFDITESFFLGINAAYQTSSYAYGEEDILDEDDMPTGETETVLLSSDFSNGFYGFALYPQVALSDSFTIGARGEYFGYHAEEGEDLPSVFATTLTGSYTVENLIIKPEIRIDSFTNAEGGLLGTAIDNDGVPADSLAAFTLAAIYSF